MIITRRGFFTKLAAVVGAVAVTPEILEETLWKRTKTFFLPPPKKILMPQITYEYIFDDRGVIAGLHKVGIDYSAEGGDRIAVARGIYQPSEDSMWFTRHLVFKPGTSSEEIFKQIHLLTEQKQ